MRRRFENVNMVMGNCFSPVMEGSQFKWNNIVVNSPVYITPIRRKKFKISFGELIYPRFCLMYHLIVIL